MDRGYEEIDWHLRLEDQKAGLCGFRLLFVFGMGINGQDMA